MLFDILAFLAAASIVAIWLRAFYKLSYMKGRAEGMRDEAVAWCNAFDSIPVPNWQSLPVDRNGDRQAQEEANKAYVRAFQKAKDEIAVLLAHNRIEALKEEWVKLGLVPRQ